MAEEVLGHAEFKQELEQVLVSLSRNQVITFVWCCGVRALPLLGAKGHFEEFGSVIDEYFEMQHAEVVPPADLGKPPDQVFYLPMHAVRKESSSTTKLRVVFDASAKSTTGVSLNDTLLVGHTVHSSLVEYCSISDLIEWD